MFLIMYPVRIFCKLSYTVTFFYKIVYESCDIEGRSSNTAICSFLQLIITTWQTYERVRRQR